MLSQVYHEQLEEAYSKAATAVPAQPPKRMHDFIDSFEFRLTSEQLKLFKDQYQIDPKKSEEELNFFIKLATIMSEASAYLCSGLKGANMEFGDVCNINHKTKPSDV